jgi:hypothetical protein
VFSEHQIADFAMGFGLRRRRIAFEAGISSPATLTRAERRGQQTEANRQRVEIPLLVF